MTRKYLEYSSGASNKFWAIELNGTSHTVTFGRIGTDGQSQVKKFTTNELAKKSFDKLLSQKFDLRAKKNCVHSICHWRQVPTVATLFGVVCLFGGDVFQFRKAGDLLAQSVVFFQFGFTRQIPVGDEHLEINLLLCWSCLSRFLQHRN